MNPILTIYNLFFYQPTLRVLFFFYQYLKDFGLAIIFLTILTRIVLFPLTLYSLRMQEKVNRIQKELKEVEKKYNGEEKTKKIVEVYKKEKINPFFGIFSLFIQFPILIALYQTFSQGIKEVSIDPKFLTIFDLSKPNLFFAFLVAISQFFYSQFQNPKREIKEKTLPLTPFQEQFNYFFSFFTFLILTKLSSAVGLYLLVNFLFLIFQKRIFHA